MASVDIYTTDKTGLLANLTTTEQGTLVGAINENAASVSDVKADFTAYKEVLVTPEKTSFFTNTTNLFNPNDSNVTTTGYYNRSNAFVTDSTSRTTGFIPVLPGHNYASSTFSETAGFVLFYVSTDSFYGYVDYTLNTSYITIPDGVYYMRIAFLKSTVGTVMINEGTSAADYEEYNPLINSEYIPTPDCIAEASENLFNASDPDIPTTGYYSRTNTLTTSSTVRSTGYVPVEGGHSYSFTHSYGGYVLWYDDEKAFLGYSDFTTSTVYVTAISGAKYARFMYLASETLSYMINEGTTLLDYVPYKNQMLYEEYMPNEYCGLHGVAFGTSLTYRAQTTGGFLQYLPSICNIDFDNQGLGSSTIMDNGSSPCMMDTIQAYTEWSSKRVCLLEGFVNDWYYNGDSLGTWTDSDTSTVCGCVRTALTYILTQNAYLTVFLILDHFGKGITATTATNSAGDTQFEFYQEIEKVALSMGVRVIREYELSEINELTPQYLLDNIHLNALGAEQSARAIWTGMKNTYPNILENS